MSITLKRWTQLGLSAAIAGSTVTACSAPQDTAAPKKDTTEMAESISQNAKAPAPEASQAGAAPIDDAAAAGEGEGEGGVSIAQAATDPVVYGSALAITHAHIIAARDAFALGEKQAAGEMFAHPVSEVLFEMQPVFEKQGVEDFSDLLAEASRAVFADETPEQINGRADAIIEALRNAAKKAPDNGTSITSITAGVIADQIDRAADMYRIAIDSDAYAPYLDGYGFYKAGEAIFLANADDIIQNAPDTAAAINEALEQLTAAYPAAVRPETLDANTTLLTVSASKVLLTIGN